MTDGAGWSRLVLALVRFPDHNEKVQMNQCAVKSCMDERYFVINSWSRERWEDTSRQIGLCFFQLCSIYHRPRIYWPARLRFTSCVFHPGRHTFVCLAPFLPLYSLSCFSCVSCTPLPFFCVHISLILTSGIQSRRPNGQLHPHVLRRTLLVPMQSLLTTEWWSEGNKPSYICSASSYSSIRSISEWLLCFRSETKGISFRFISPGCSRRAGSECTL